MSFVNLMAYDVWSDADITARTEAMLRAQWSVQAQTILSRKAVGVALGQFTLSPEEEEELGAFAYASMQAFPTGVGMNRQPWRCQHDSRCVPHRRGDEPVQA